MRLKHRLVSSDTRTYYSAEDFVRDLRVGNFKENFTISEEVFQCLAVMAHADTAFAKEIADNGVLLAMCCSQGSEIDGLLKMAEVVALEV